MLTLPKSTPTEETVLLDTPDKRIALKDVYPQTESFQSLSSKLISEIFVFSNEERASRHSLHMLLVQMSAALRTGDNPLSCILKAVPLSLLVDAEKSLQDKPDQITSIQCWKQFDLAIVLLSRLITAINEGNRNEITRDIFVYLRDWVSSMANIFIDYEQGELAFPGMPSGLNPSDQWLRVNDLLTVIYSFDPETGGKAINEAGQIKRPLRNHLLVLEDSLDLSVEQGKAKYPMSRLMSALATYTYIYAQTPNKYSFPLHASRVRSERFGGGYILLLTEKLRDYLLLADYGKEALRNDFFGNAIEVIKNIKEAMPSLGMSQETCDAINELLKQAAYIAVCGGYGTSRHYRADKYAQMSFPGKDILNEVANQLQPLLAYHDIVMRGELELDQEVFDSRLSRVPGNSRLAVRSLLAKQSSLVSEGKWQYKTAELPAVQLA